MPSKTRDIVDWALFGADPIVNQSPPSKDSEDGRPESDQELPVPRRRTGPSHPAFALWKAIWHRDQHTWNPQALQIRPLVGLAAICVTVGCVFASLVVLIYSNGQGTADWPLSPSIALAIITAVSNSAIALAHMEAVPISWWYSTTRGRSIRALERQWKVTRSALQVSSSPTHVTVFVVRLGS